MNYYEITSLARLWLWLNIRYIYSINKPLRELLPAGLALVALLAAVHSLVALEVGARHERQPALGAGVRLHPAVAEFVHLEGGRVDEGLTAQVTLESKVQI